VRIGDSRRFLFWALLVAAAIGFACGWWARIWTQPTPESRAREAADRIRDRVREMTH
jgi:hypothetical protein